MSQGYIFYHLRAQVFNERQVQVQKTQLNSEDFKYTLQVMSHNNKAQDVWFSHDKYALYKHYTIVIQVEY